MGGSRIRQESGAACTPTATARQGSIIHDRSGRVGHPDLAGKDLYSVRGGGLRSRPARSAGLLACWSQGMMDGSGDMVARLAPLFVQPLS